MLDLLDMLKSNYQVHSLVLLAKMFSWSLFFKSNRVVVFSSCY